MTAMSTKMNSEYTKLAFKVNRQQ